MWLRVVQTHGINVSKQKPMLCAESETHEGTESHLSTVPAYATLREGCCQEVCPLKGSPALSRHMSGTCQVHNALCQHIWVI